jgi:formylglycine-generating enzyme required for sulfatase activity
VRDVLAQEIGEDRFGAFMIFMIGKVVQRMRWVPAGTFLMGSSDSEAGRWEDEGPQHAVTISEGYWLAETPCTQALWVAVMGNNPSRFKSPDRPTESVSWDDCKVFLARLNDRVPGLEARLPTEAEWERACRAGTTGATWGGALDLREDGSVPVLDPIAWYRLNGGMQTHPVAKKQPNPLGLHDMLGNVYEWCEDWMGPYDAERVIDPRGPRSGSSRVIRGGAWSSSAQRVRAALRFARDPAHRFDNLGFRLARGQGGLGRGAEPGPQSGPTQDAGRGKGRGARDEALPPRRRAR